MRLTNLAPLLLLVACAGCACYAGVHDPAWMSSSGPLIHGKDGTSYKTALWARRHNYGESFRPEDGEWLEQQEYEWVYRKYVSATNPMPPVGELKQLMQHRAEKRGRRRYDIVTLATPTHPTNVTYIDVTEFRGNWNTTY